VTAATLPAPALRPGQGSTALAGTGALVRLALRRDRVMLPVWTVVFLLTVVGTGAATVGVYPTAESRVTAANSFNSSGALVAFYGRIYDSASLGAIAVWKLVALGAALVAVLGAIVVVRHSRAEEEAGRLELLGATVVGRYAGLTAALLVAVGANVVIGVLAALGLIASGLPAAGSFAFGLCWAGAGIAFAATAAVTAQLTESTRAATGLAMAVLGLAYLLRAAGDAASATGPQWLHWLSPIGWTQQIRPYAGDRWWAGVFPLVYAAAAVLAAYALVARRDLGAGLLAARSGPASGGRWLGSPLALAWRLHRGTLLAWAGGFVLGGALFGSLASNLSGLVDTPNARDLITRLGGVKGLSDAFLATELGVAGVVASAFGVQAALRLRTEETGLRAEPLLATGVSRVRWAASHLALALGGSALLLVLAGLAGGAVHAERTRDAGQLGRVLAAALAQVPAAWVLTGVTLAAFGLVPRLAVAGWAALVVFLLLGELGPVLRLPQPLMDLSPYAHSPRLPGAHLDAAPLLWLLAVTAALVATGLAAFRRRDLVS
jgi:ABC-2 type transport system permease protein